MGTQELRNFPISTIFYERRYTDGYMNEWPEDKKKRIFMLIRELPLPGKGIALDFGCGNGVLTSVIKQALPEWEVYGCDISAVAVNNARHRYPNCKYFILGAKENQNLHFDFIFSHHVIEHVCDLEETFADLNRYTKPSCRMLHILPCGNEGSYAHHICKLRKDGINSVKDNRYFFEDEGHLRRLTSDQFNHLLEKYGFRLSRENYSNQLNGEIYYMTGLSKEFIENLTDATNAIDEKAVCELQLIRKQLLRIYWMRCPVTFVKEILARDNKRPKHYLYLLLGFGLFPLSYPFDLYFKYRTSLEWAKSKDQQNGGEMYLFYER